MHLNLSDPDSIVAWWRVPQRHDGYLEQKLRLSPELGPSILEAQRRITASEELQLMLAASVAQRRRQDAFQAEHRASMTSVELLRRDLAVA